MQVELKRADWLTRSYPKIAWAKIANDSFGNSNCAKPYWSILVWKELFQKGRLHVNIYNFSEKRSLYMEVLGNHTDINLSDYRHGYAGTFFIILFY